MENRALTVVNLVAPRVAGLLTVLLLTGSAALAAGPSTPPAAATAGPDYCAQVKDAGVRSTCEISRTQYYNGNVRAALATMRKAMQAAPKEGVLSAMAGRIMIRMGDTGSAERALRQARKDGAPDHFVLPVLFGAMVAQHEEINLLNEFPEPAANAKGEVIVDILQGRALAFQSLDKLPEAAASSDRALALHRDPDLLLLRAKIAGDQKNTALAGKLVDEAYKLDPHSVPVLMAKVHQFELSGNDAGVLAMSDEVLRLVPTYVNARVAKIKVFLKRNDDANAKKEVDFFLARSSKSPYGLYFHAVLLSRAKDKTTAAQTIQALPPEFVRTYPEYGPQMAQILFDNGNVETGAAVLGASISANPDLLEARLRLASLRLSQNSPQSALTLLTPVKDSTDPRVQKLLGQVKAKIAKDRAF